jgi:hypothetical protein
MAELHLLASSYGTGTCRSCGALMVWATNAKTGKKIPFNGEIVPIRSYHDEDHRLIEVIDSTVSISHFGTCPQAAEWRKK